MGVQYIRIFYTVFLLFKTEIKEFPLFHMKCRSFKWSEESLKIILVLQSSQMMFVLPELGPQFGNELTGVMFCTLYSSVEDKKAQSRLTPVDLIARPRHYFIHWKL